ncbi:MAG: hypothetical protein ACRDID_09935 [Ktedonobacterales bacterium]
MATIVFTTLWGQQSDGVSPPASAQVIEDQADEMAISALASETPDVIDISTCVFPADYAVDGEQLSGYCIMAAVKVQQETLSLQERLVLCQQVEDTLTRALGTLFSFLRVHSLETTNESELSRPTSSRESLRG